MFTPKIEEMMKFDKHIFSGALVQPPRSCSLMIPQYILKCFPPLMYVCCRYPSRSSRSTSSLQFSSCWGCSVVSFWWPPCSVNWPPTLFKPEAQKVVYKVKQNPARRGSYGETGEPEQNGGPPPAIQTHTPKQKAPTKNGCLEDAPFPFVVFLLVAYFQVFFAVSFREDSRRGGILRDNHHRMGLLTTYRVWSGFMNHGGQISPWSLSNPPAYSGRHFRGLPLESLHPGKFFLFRGPQKPLGSFTPPLEGPKADSSG